MTGAPVIESLDHVVIAVRDLDAAAETYTALLGRGASWRGAHALLGTANALFRLPNTYLELLSPAGAGPVADGLRERLADEGEGLWALAFGTGDAAACAAALRGRGVGASDPVDGAGRDAATGAERHWRNVYLPESDTRGVLVFAIEHRSPAASLPPAAPLAGAGAAIDGLDHVVVLSTDPEDSRAFYGDRLGLRLALDRRVEQRGLRLLFFRVGGVTVEIAANLDAPSGAAATDRLWGLAYRVGDVAAARARLAAAGFEVSETRRGQKPGTAVCTVRRETCGVATLLVGPADAGAR